MASLRRLSRAALSQSISSSAGPRLLGPADVRELAERHSFHPSKQRGQNFVIDPNTVRRIVRTAELDRSDVVLEVGPGFGSLTLAMLDAVSQVTAIEVDAVLAGALAATVAERAPSHADRLTVVHGDALQVESVPHPLPTAVVANLPYNVAVPVLLHLLASLPSVRRVLVMVQLEVADRLVASPGSKIYGVPSVKAAWFGEARRVGVVGRTVFWPAPRVDSGLVALDRQPPPLSRVGRDSVFEVVDAAFGQRRKMLRTALAGLAGSPSRVEAVLEAAGVDPTSRGERLSIADFVRIADCLGPPS